MDQKSSEDIRNAKLKASLVASFKIAVGVVGLNITPPSTGGLSDIATDNLGVWSSLLIAHSVLDFLVKYGQAGTGNSQRPPEP